MTRYQMSAAQAADHIPDHPERTGRASLGDLFDFDVTFQVWPSRAAMLKSIEMQGRAMPTRKAWMACQP